MNVPRADVPETSGPPPLLSSAPDSGCGGDDQQLDTWKALRIGENAAVVVWRRSPPQPAADGTVDWLSNIEWQAEAPDGELNLRHAWLYNSQSPEVWCWSLVVVPKGQWSEPGLLTLKLHGPRFEGSLAMHTVRFNDEDLTKILNAAAEVLLPADAPRSSLEAIRAKATELMKDSAAPASDEAQK